MSVVVDSEKKDRACYVLNMDLFIHYLSLRLPNYRDRYFKGFRALPFLTIAKKRWGPVDRPVLPLKPIF